jgi:hypothetical protein
MFGIFRKKTSSQEVASYFKNLAKTAQIDAVYRDGDYCGFLIYVDADGVSLAANNIGPSAMSVFVNAIETRIKEGHFEDLMREENRHLETIGISTGNKNLNVPRAVLGKEKKPLFNWSPPPAHE